MFKFIKKSSFILTLLLGSFAVNATLMDSSLMTDDHYITVTHDDGSVLDWAWVSSVSVNFTYDDFGVLENTLFSPDLIEGWELASSTELSYFLLNIDSDDFKNTLTDPGNGLDTHKKATYFWNDNFHEVNLDNLNEGDIKSSWVENSEYNFLGTSYYDTFYVRTHSTDPQPVPEPSTLMIFALGLIAFASKKKALLKSTK